MEGAEVETECVPRRKRFNENVCAVRVNFRCWQKRRVFMFVFRSRREVPWSVGLSVPMGALEEPDSGLGRGGVQGYVYGNGLGSIYAVVRKVVVPWRGLLGAWFFCESVIMEKLGGLAFHELCRDRCRLGGENEEKVFGD